MDSDDLLRRRTEVALLARPWGRPIGPAGGGRSADMAVEPCQAPIDDAYDIVQAMLLALYREVSVQKYAEMQPAAREQYHIRTAEYFRSRAAVEARLAAYFIARAVLHDECAKVAVTKSDGQAEQLSGALDCNVILEVLGLINPLPSTTEEVT